MGPRRSHKKSRNGCKECKNRRIKCNECNPCENCTKHKIPCSYVPPEERGESSRYRREPIPEHPAGWDSSQDTPLSFDEEEHQNLSRVLSIEDHSSFPWAINSGKTPLDSKPGVSDVELMHHFSTRTYKTLSNREDIRIAWQVAVPQESFSHEFLLRNILSISALHLAYLYPEKCSMYTALSAYHQDIGLKKFRDCLVSLTDDKFKATFSFASLLVVYVSALPIRNCAGHLLSPIDNFIDLFEIVLGIEIFLKNGPLLEGDFAPFSHSWMDEEPSRITLDESSRVVIDSKIPHDLPAQLQRLREIVQRHSKDQEELVILIRALDSLNETLKQVKMSEFSIECGTVIAWPFFAGRPFVTLLRNRQPIALILIAYYCIALHCAEDYWFFQSWAKDLFHEVEKNVPLEFWQWMAHPRSVVFAEKGNRVGDSSIGSKSAPHACR